MVIVRIGFFGDFLRMLFMKKCLNHLTIADKVHVIQLVEGNRKKQDIAKEFNIPPYTMSIFFKNKADIKKKMMTMKLTIKGRTQPNI